MESENKKNVTPNINEELMMNLMVDGVKKEGLRLPFKTTSESIATEESNVNEALPEKPLAKEKSRTKKVNEALYENIFFRKTDTNARDGKTVYIRPQFHEKLTRIIQVIGEDKISIYSYLDNLLDHHFQEFSEEITKNYNNKYKPI
ncbi:DUF3408 domain-containing protein [Flavobacterium poyangense]|uniref:DUF3408 domain-containing protein n=1 Tax=Flavobacterium poyangense TaxID=2204302 RepID=UPI00142470FE|nr:DUF3408 domain-containing protein [Flavobacterium sp. JXAS1]